LALAPFFKNAVSTPVAVKTHFGFSLPTLAALMPCSAAA